jgi:hypothetical protein
MFGRKYSPLFYIRNMLSARDWKILDHQQDNYTLKVKKYIMKLDSLRADMLFRDWFREWKKYYLPPFSLSGKTVLDVGSEEGNTCLFWFVNGAQKVICVEPDRERFDYLKENASRNAWNVELINKEFYMEILSKFKFDFVKMDCEGCEEALLDLPKLEFPLTMEVHSPELMEKFKTKYGMKVEKEPYRGIFLMNNFSR